MKLILQVFLSALIFSLAVFSACSSDSEEELEPDPQTAQCDTQNITYTNTVVGILSANCNNCHSTAVASGGVRLDTYAGVRAQATNGNLMGTITHSPGYPHMPQGGAKLSDCNIAKIQAWVSAGALNN